MELICSTRQAETKNKTKKMKVVKVNPNVACGKVVPRRFSADLIKCMRRTQPIAVLTLLEIKGVNLIQLSTIHSCTGNLS